MNVFIYEFVTGGGWYGHADEAPPESLASEGRAMLEALAADFVALHGASVDVMRDARYGAFEIHGVTVHPVKNAAEERRTLARLSAAADWTVLIAPEFEGQLLHRVRAAERAGGRLLGPSSQVVTLTSDKHATAEHLERHAVAVPRGRVLAPGEALPADFDYPAVLKPRDGAGSLGIEWIEARTCARTSGTPKRLEVYCPGRAASVACLCGPDRIVPLEPCRQLLAGDGDFAYLGGSLPLPADLAARARRLAVQAVRSLPGPLGYLGVDLVLGSDPAGSGDVAIEINPRLTTSYVGLRAHSSRNLAAAMIAVAQGGDAELCWNSGGIRFTSSGNCGPSSAPDDP